MGRPFANKVKSTWSIADLPGGYYKTSEYGRYVLPITVLRRLDFRTDQESRYMYRRGVMPPSGYPVANPAGGQA